MSTSPSRGSPPPGEVIVVERLDHRLVRAGPIHEVWGVRSTLGWWYIQWPSGSGSGVQTSSEPGRSCRHRAQRAARPGRRGCPGRCCRSARRLHFREELGVEHALGVGGRGSGDHDMIGFADHGRDVVHHGHAWVRCVGPRRRTPMTFISSASERRATSDPMPPIPRITTVAPAGSRPGSRVGTNRPVVGRGRRRGVPWRLRASGRRPTHRSIRR